MNRGKYTQRMSLLCSVPFQAINVYLNAPVIDLNLSHLGFQEQAGLTGPNTPQTMAITFNGNTAPGAWVILSWEPARPLKQLGLFRLPCRTRTDSDQPDITLPRTTIHPSRSHLCSNVFFSLGLKFIYFEAPDPFICSSFQCILIKAPLCFHTACLFN